MSRHGVILTLSLLVVVGIGPGYAHLTHRADDRPVVRTLALDQAPLDVVTDPVTGHAFVLTMASGPSGVYGLGNASQIGLVWMLDSATGTVLQRTPVAVAAGLLYATVAPAQHCLVVLTGSAHVAVLDTRTGTRLALLPLGGLPQGVAVDDRGGRVFVLTNTGRLSVLDARTGRLLRSVVSGTLARHVLTTVARAGRHTAVVLDTPYPQQARRAPQLSPLIGLNTGLGAASGLDANRRGDVAVDAQTARLFVTDPSTSRVYVLDAHTGRLVRTIRMQGPPQEVVVDQRAGHVFIHSAVNESLSMLDARSGRLLRSIPLPGDVTAWAVDEGRGLLLVTSQDQQAPSTEEVRMVDTYGGVLIRTLSLATDGYPVAVAVDTAEARALVVSMDGVVPAPAPLSWALQWVQGLRQVLPWVPEPWRPSPSTGVPGSVSVLDTIRLR